MEQGREALFFYASRKFTAGNRLFTNCAGKNMENFLFPEGISKKRNFMVSEEQTARYLGSGRSDVLATPALVAWMEAVAQEIVDDVLPTDWQSVGNYIELRHSAMVPVGSTVEIQAVLSRVDEKELIFAVSAFDESGIISEGIHKRTFSRTAVLKRLLKRKK